MLSFKKRWEAFCGYSMEDSEKHFMKTIDLLNIPVKPTESSMNRTQNFILGSEGKTKSIRIGGENENEIEVRITSVSRDPLYKFVMSIVGSQEKEVISLVSIYPVNSNTKPMISKIIKGFFEQASQPPWNIDHPRFKLSFILNYRNKKKWLYWS